MPNDRYISGKNLENRIKRKLKDADYFVQRAPASKGVADLLAIKKILLNFYYLSDGRKVSIPDSFAYEGHRLFVHDVLMVSCRKAERMTAEEREALKAAAEKYGARAMTTKKNADGEWVLVEVS